PLIEQGDDVVEDRGALAAPVLPGEEAVPWLEARAARLERGRARDPGQREITDRDHVRDVGGARATAAGAAGVELVDIAAAQAGLLLDPGAQPDLEGAMRQRIERPEGKSGAHIRFVIARHQDRGLAGLDADDRGGQPDFDRRESSFRHRYSRSSRNGSPAEGATPGPTPPRPATQPP